MQGSPEQDDVVKMCGQEFRDATKSAIGASTPPARDLSPEKTYSITRNAYF